MPNRKNLYKNMEKYQKTRTIQRRRYYNKTSIYERSAWTPEQDQLILIHSMTDSEISNLIKHSVKAIQTRRYRLKQKKINKV